MKRSSQWAVRSRLIRACNSVPIPTALTTASWSQIREIIGAGCYGKQKIQLLKCKACNGTFSERRGTPLFNLKASEETFYDVIACLAEGNGIRATARIKNVDRDTVADWLDKASHVGSEVGRRTSRRSALGLSSVPLTAGL
jgi:transposase-like protein